jgi:hypothetical protein
MGSLVRLCLYHLDLDDRWVANSWQALVAVASVVVFCAVLAGHATRQLRRGRTEYRRELWWAGLAGLLLPVWLAWNACAEGSDQWCRLELAYPALAAGTLAYGIWGVSPLWKGTAPGDRRRPRGIAALLLLVAVILGVGFWPDALQAGVPGLNSPETEELPRLVASALPWFPWGPVQLAATAISLAGLAAVGTGLAVASRRVVGWGLSVQVPLLVLAAVQVPIYVARMVHPSIAVLARDALIPEVFPPLRYQIPIGGLVRTGLWVVSLRWLWREYRRMPSKPEVEPAAELAVQ